MYQKEPTGLYTRLCIYQKQLDMSPVLLLTQVYYPLGSIQSQIRIVGTIHRAVCIIQTKSTHRQWITNDGQLSIQRR